MKRWRPALWALGLLLIVAAAAAAWRLRAPQVDVVTLGTAPLVRTLQFSARVATTSRVSVGATLTGRVAHVAVREGDAVRQGDVLLRIDTREADQAVAAAAANVAAAQALGLQGMVFTDAAACRRQLVEQGWLPA